jgi:hypothetical protein
MDRTRYKKRLFSENKDNLPIFISMRLDSQWFNHLPIGCFESDSRWCSHKTSPKTSFTSSGYLILRMKSLSKNLVLPKQTFVSNGIHQNSIHKCEILIPQIIFSKVGKLDEKEQWLIDYVTNEQEGNVTDPMHTNSEMEYRFAMAEHFNITEDWAYEIIKKIVERNHNFHLEKVIIEEWRGKKCREKVLTYIKKP